MIYIISIFTLLALIFILLFGRDSQSWWINILISLNYWRQKHFHLFILIYLYHTYKYVKVKVLACQLCSTLCDPMDCSLSSSVPEIPQARILKWVTILFSRGSSRPRDWTWVSFLVGRSFMTWATREVHSTDLNTSGRFWVYRWNFNMHNLFGLWMQS